MRKRPLASVFAVLIASTLIVPVGLSRAQLPSLGDGADMTASAERRLGDRIAREIYRDPDYMDDPLLVDYLQSIWLPLMTAARSRGELSPELDERFAWELFINRERTVNAFALPGGYLGVNLGLIGLVTSRDELASVLGHELSHVTQRHISRLMAKQSQQAPWILAAMVLGALAARKNPDAANAAITGGQALAVQNQLNFSRDMEREADRVGYGVMTGAGFEPQAFASMFEKLQQASRLNDNGSFPYLRSHPLTTERIADVQARVQLQPASPRRAAPDLVHGMMSGRARVLGEPGVDALRSWVHEASLLAAAPGAAGTAAAPAASSALSLALTPALPASGAAARGRAPAGLAGAAPAVRRAGVLYAGALSAAKLREFGQARTLLARLGAAAAGDAEAQRTVQLLGAEIALLERNPAQALQALGAEGGRAPAAAERRPDLLLWAQARLQAGGGSLGDVAQRLQAWVVAHPRDALVWQQLSTVQGAMGLPVQAARSGGEARAAQLDYQAALDRFKAAQDLLRKNPPARGGNDYIEASIIDLRTRELETRVRELAREQALER